MNLLKTVVSAMKPSTTGNGLYRKDPPEESANNTDEDYDQNDSNDVPGKFTLISN